MASGRIWSRSGYPYLALHSITTLLPFSWSAFRECLTIVTWRCFALICANAFFKPKYPSLVCNIYVNQMQKNLEDWKIEVFVSDCVWNVLNNLEIFFVTLEWLLRKHAARNLIFLQLFDDFYLKWICRKECENIPWNMCGLMDNRKNQILDSDENRRYSNWTPCFVMR